MTNFDFLQEKKEFKDFANIAIAAENSINTDASYCAFNCRKSLEMAVKWMYSIEPYLDEPRYGQTLSDLIGNFQFQRIVPQERLTEIYFIKKRGNEVAHELTETSYDIAKVCLKNLFNFYDFLSVYYLEDKERTFDESLLAQHTESQKHNENTVSEEEFQKIKAENKELREKLKNRKTVKIKRYVPKPLDLSEYNTRKLYIDTMLIDVGWKENQDWINEVELEGMPNKSGNGFADYVLYDDAHKPLAVIEAKRTYKDVAEGRQQAKLYADILEKKYKRRPVIFLTNGFETRIIDNVYPERIVSSIYSKRDLEKWFNLQSQKQSLKNIKINKEIAGKNRPYQEQAIKAVCESFEANKRKALLVMATGSGKTRTVIALCDVLIKNGWVKNVLFLADRTSLVTQAKRNFTTLLPSLPNANLCDTDPDYNARCVFSTYQTIINCIDNAKDKEGKIFSSGHFDLIICDEAHRSIYNKYRDIFNYFDAPLVGLTATPKDEIDKNTYEVFELENGIPTFGYELGQAVKEGVLVDYSTIETRLKFLEDGINYDQLSDEEKEEFEETFEDEDGEVPDTVNSSALNQWVFNEDTIKQVLNILMKDGIHINYGETLGKTIIFAKNHKHAEEILRIFNKTYPQLPDFAKVIDNYSNYSQSLIDDFSDPKKMPQIAISVDMLDTGIDVPEILNLVFFKKVLSKAKFWQMIGRGTRLCPGLLDDGKDKEEFYIFDFCNNFNFFRMNKGIEAASVTSLQTSLFNLKCEIILKLQDGAYQTEDLIEFRKQLVSEIHNKITELDKNNFAVHQHIKYVDIFSNIEKFQALSSEDVLNLKNEVAPLVLPDDDEVNALRFDALMYGVELAYLVGKKKSRGYKDLLHKVSALSQITTIPEVKSHLELINLILDTDYLDKAGINEFEHIRSSLRDLLKYIPVHQNVYITNFTDDILGMDWNESDLEDTYLETYRERAESYVRQHMSEPIFAKIQNNQPLSKADVAELEDILWNQLGSKEEYTQEYGEEALGEFVRSIVGLDMKAAQKAFSSFLDNNNLDSKQIYFVNQIIEYIVQNGMIKDFSILQGHPFTSHGSIADIFKDLTVWNNLKKVIDNINMNAKTA